MRLRPGRAAQPGQGLSRIALLRRTGPAARPSRGIAAPRSAAILARRRVLRGLRQVVGDLEPRRFVRHEDMAFRSYSGVVVEHSEGNAKLGEYLRIAHGEARMRLGAVDDRRTAHAAKAAAITGSCFVIGHQLLALKPFEVGPPDASAAAKCGALLFAAQRAMAIQRPQQRAGDLELDAAAQAASVNSRHLRPPLARSAIRR